MPTDRDLFLSALDIPDPAARAEYLGANAPDADQRARVSRLLAAHARADGFLEQSPDEANPPRPASDLTRSLAPAPEQPGERIVGRYKLLQRLGEGGMGTVWQAEQTEPIKRRVAVKLIRADPSNSVAITARFGAERQAVALMDHPNIAHLLDAGTTDAGAPFFVMELVNGTPLTEYCDTHLLSVPERLELFVRICGAVQHAHQKGIIHRDLKPTNILVEDHDGKPVPKVIDFGLAKATHGIPLTDHTLFTGFGTVLGTPMYMAPEQATFNAVDVDTRADVYALGAVLYELLTGTTPITRDTVKKAALDEVLKLIREQETPPPSRRLGSSDILPSVATCRKTEPTKLGRCVKGELDWIVMKALAKERDRRYETANALARDVERYLADEVVEAQPPSKRYRLKKFVRRNAKALATVAAFVLLLVLGAGLCARQAIKARRAEAETRAVLDFFQNKVLSAARPRGLEGGQGGDISLRAALDAAEPEIAPAFDGHPRAEAEIRFTLGLNYSALGEHAKAVRQLERVLSLSRETFGNDEPYTIAAMTSLANELQMDGRRTEALPLAEEALKRAHANPGANESSLPFVMSVLAAIYQKERKFADAIALLEEALQYEKARVGPDHPDTLLLLNNLAWAYDESGQRTKAVPLYAEALRGLRIRPGSMHPTTLLTMFNLGWTYDQMGRLEDAIPLLDESLKGSEITLGPDHPTTRQRLDATYWAHERLGQWRELAVIVVAHSELLRRKVPPDRQDLLLCLRNEGLCQLKAGNPVAAEAPLRECLRSLEPRFLDHWALFEAKTLLGESLLSQKKYVEAEPLLLKGYEGMKAREKTIPSAIQVRLLETVDNLLALYTATNKPDEVKKWRAERAKYPLEVAPAPRERK
jgi:serine/threonine protein kinase